jgi:hypothetical protein
MNAGAGYATEHVSVSEMWGGCLTVLPKGGP